jgi:AraC-like DNA-binding protein
VTRPRDGAADFRHNRRVHSWRVHYDTKLGVKQHEVEHGWGHALLAPAVGYAFRALRVSAALWEHGADWLPIHAEPNVFGFAIQHGKGGERAAYNGRCFAKVLRNHRALRGEHAGFSDLFAPIVRKGKVAAVLVVGPFGAAPPTSADVLASWRWLTGRQGHPTDPAFASYLALTLETLVLDTRQAQKLGELMGCFTQLMAGEGDADTLTNRTEVLRAELEQARSIDRMWESVRVMLDERRSRMFHDAALRSELHALGLSRMPESLLVALTGRRSPALDPVDEAIRRRSFQRRCVELGHKVGDTIAGQVGDHGVVFLSAAKPSAERERKRLRDLVDRAALLAEREFGFSLCFGVGRLSGSEPLHRGFQAALGAAESALVQGVRLVTAAPGELQSAHPLRRLREELTRLVEEGPDLLGPRFEQYVEAVTAHCGHRADASRGHLDAGFEQMAGPLVRSGALDAKSYRALCDGLDRAAAEARTLDDLCAAYRRAVADVAAAVAQPVSARHGRSMRRAIEYVDQHYSEAIRRSDAARVAGIAPAYFSRLFREHEGTTFENHVGRLRLARAQQLLASTGLGIARVAEMSGFRSAPYFCRVFRAATGTTPAAYRRAPQVTSVQEKRSKV